MTGVLNELRHQPLLWLLVFVPVVFVVEASAPEAHTALFGLAILAIVPLAALLSHATESVAANRKSKSHAELRITKHLMPAFGNKPLSITTAHVQAYSASRLEAGAAGATINRELCVLKLAFRLMDVPKPRIEMLKESDPRTRFFEADQIAAVVQHLPAPLRAVVLFLYFSGWRKSEALSRQMRHVDFNACTVRLEPGETKNSKGRVLKFDQMPELKACWKRSATNTNGWRGKAGSCRGCFTVTGSRSCRSIPHGEPSASVRACRAGCCTIFGAPRCAI